MCFGSKGFWRGWLLSRGFISGVRISAMDIEMCPSTTWAHLSEMDWPSVLSSTSSDRTSCKRRLFINGRWLGCRSCSLTMRVKYTKIPSGMFKLFSVVYSYFMQKIFGHLHFNLCLVTKYLDTFCELEENWLHASIWVAEENGKEKLVHSSIVLIVNF